MPYNSSDGFNGPVATNDFDDKYQMNQLWMYLIGPRTRTVVVSLSAVTST